MRTKILLVGPIVAAAIGVAAWLGWRWYTTPPPPVFSLAAAEPSVLNAVEQGLDAVRADPRSGAAWGNLAMILIANGFKEESLSCLPYAEKFDPGNPRWPYFRGIQLAVTRGQVGIPFIERALVLAQTQDQEMAIRFRLAFLLIETERLDEAEIHVQALGRLEPASPRFDLLCGLMGMRRHNKAAALAHLSKLTNSPFARKRACRLMASLAEGDHLKVKSYMDQAAKSPPDLPWPDPLVAELPAFTESHRTSKYAEVSALLAEGRNAEALDYLRQRAGETADQAIYFYLGDLYLNNGDLAMAEEMLRAAIRLDASNMQVHFRLGDCLLRRAEQAFKQPDGKGRAMELLRQAAEAEDQVLAVNANDGHAHLVRGRALYYLGRRDEALIALRQAILCRPDLAGAYLALGEALGEMGEIREAVGQIETAVRLGGPDAPLAREALGRWRARLKSPPGPKRSKSGKRQSGLEPALEIKGMQPLIAAAFGGRKNCEKRCDFRGLTPENPFAAAADGRQKVVQWFQKHDFLPKRLEKCS